MMKESDSGKTQFASEDVIEYQHKLEEEKRQHQLSLNDAHELTDKLEAENAELRAKIAKYHCPIGLEDKEINGISICSAGYCYKCLQRRIANHKSEIAELRQRVAVLVDFINGYCSGAEGCLVNGTILSSKAKEVLEANQPIADAYKKEIEAKAVVDFTNGCASRFNLNSEQMESEAEEQLLKMCGEYVREKRKST